jgi:phosphinothricin acetyltransferase
MSAADAALVIRPATPKDLPRLTEIYNHYVAGAPTVTFDTEPVTVAQRRPWFDRYALTGRHRLLLAERAGMVLGYTTSSPFHGMIDADTTVETTILCAPEAVGHGIGRLLYGALFDALENEDIHSIMALITLPNPSSCALHEYFGYREMGVMTEAGRKFGQYWDVAFYQKMVGG